MTTATATTTTPSSEVNAESVHAAAATTTSEVSQQATVELVQSVTQTTAATVVPSVSVVTPASNSIVSVVNYEGLAASLNPNVLFSTILMALIHLI